MESLVSVIVPTYNSEETIQRCIESLLRQTYKELEIIVVNDGSSDCTAEILKDYKEKISVIEQTNQGVSVARNEGIARAKGIYLVFVDSDDYVSDDYVQSLVDVNTAESKLVVGRHIVSCNGRRELEEIFSNGAYTISATDSGSISKLLRNFLLQGPCCKLFYRETIIKNRIKFDSNMCFGEDFKFVLEYLNIVKEFHFINKKIYYYCMNSSSLTSVISRKRVDSFLKLSHYFWDFIVTNGLEKTEVVSFYYYNILCDYVNFNLINFSVKSGEMREIYDSLKMADVVKKAKENRTQQKVKNQVLLSADYYWVWRFAGLAKRWKNRALG